MGTLRRVEVILSVALLATFLIGGLRDRVSLAVVVVGVCAIVAYLVLRSVWPRLRRKVKALRPAAGVELELLPPPERYASRDPVPFSALTRAIEAAQLGRIERSDPGALRLVTRAGEWLELSSTSPTTTTLQTLRMQTSSGDLAAFACDALVSRVGPLTLRVEGVEVFIDGTLPLSELERTLHDLRMTRMQQLRHELNELEDAKQAPPPRTYLN